MNKILLLLCSTALGWCLAAQCVGQAFKGDTAFLDSAIANAVNAYHDATRAQSELYNGSDFKFYQPLKEEHPYFLSDDWIEGTISYDGTVYSRVYIQYDIERDEVIVEHPNGTRIKLTKLSIDHFMINGHKFVLISTGQEKQFHEVLYDGDTKVYARHTKVFQETMSDGNSNRYFREKTRYLIYKDGTYFSVNKKSSVYNALNDKKKELRQFASRNNLRFGINRMEFITELTKQYDRIR